MKITTAKLQEYKKINRKIASLTAYDYSSAKLFDEAGIDAILIGDSVGQVILGYDSTTKVSMDEMKIFTSAVARGVKNALVIADMPFLSYQTSISEAIKNAGELIKSGADAVKLEGISAHTLEVVKRCTQSGIPVCGHLGFTPQFIGTIGGHFVIGKDFEMTLELLKQAKELENAGAFAIVLEMVPMESAKFISKNLKIPTIGIGAGVGCDGQILVSEDILGKFRDFCPKFARKYANLAQTITDSAKHYIEDVKNGNFPRIEESFTLKEEEKLKLESYQNN